MPNREKKKHTLSYVIMIVTVIIAIAAVGVSVWEGIENRRHNRLFCKPYLMFNTNVSILSPEVGIFVENCGFGPALVRNFEILVDDNLKDSWSTVLKELSLVDSESSWLEWTYLNKESTIIGPGVSRGILAIKQENFTVDRMERFKKALSKLDVRIGYQSIYEDNFTVSLKKDKQADKK